MKYNYNFTHSLSGGAKSQFDTQMGSVVPDRTFYSAQCPQLQCPQLNRSQPMTIPHILSLNISCQPSRLAIDNHMITNKSPHYISASSLWINQMPAAVCQYIPFIWCHSPLVRSYVGYYVHIIAGNGFWSVRGYAIRCSRSSIPEEKKMGLVWGIRGSGIVGTSVCLFVYFLVRSVLP